MSTPVLPSTKVGEMLLALSECVCEELEVTGAGPTCWCGLYPGDIVSWESCGECGGANCGMGYVRLASIFPYDTFPNPVIDQRCVLPLALQVEVGALRCFPTTVDGSPPDPAATTEASLLQAADTLALYRALRCCTSYAVGVYQPVGPLGGCVGGFWTAYLPLD